LSATSPSHVVRRSQLADGTIDRSQARETRFEYNQFGSLVKTIFADGTFTTVEYDSRHRKVAEVDQLGNRTQYEYDAAGRLSAVVLPAVPNPQNNGQLASPRYEYAYDGQGNQTLIQDPLGRRTTFTFDARGRQLTRTLPLGQGQSGAFTERFEYDDFGRQTLHVSFEGVVTQFVYDDGPSRTGRLAEKKFFDNLVAFNNGAGTPTEKVAYAYDAFGRQVAEVWSTRNASGILEETRRVETAYDAEGRVTSILSPEGRVSYEYDALGRRVRTFTGSPADPESDFRYEYDALNRLTKVAVWERGHVPLAEGQRETTRYEYDLVGNLDLERKASGIVTDYVFDALGRLDKLTHYSPDATPHDLSDNPKLAEFDYTVRADGKRTRADEFRHGAQTGTFRWEYDAVGRLVDEIFDSYEDNALDYTARYSFDLAGNRLEKSLWKTAAPVSGTPDEHAAYLYDANDRLLEETLDLLVGSDQRTTYAWGSGSAATYQTAKSVTDLAAGQLVEQTSYAYNLQGRLSQAVIEKYSAGQLVRRDTSTFAYGDDGIRLDNCYEDPRICDCLMTYNKGAGLNLLGCHDIVVVGNQFEENLDAVRCSDGFNLCFTGNCVDDHLGNGVVIENTYGSVVAGNMIEECNGTAIILDRDCYGITLSASVIAHEVAGGIDLRDAHGCAVSGNTFTIVKQNALVIGEKSGRITVTGNNFSNSYIGEGAQKRTRVDSAATGIVLRGTSDITLSGNLFSGLTSKAVTLEGPPSRRVNFSGNVLSEASSDHGQLAESRVEANVE
jgi:YD repeat-containing protein